jgi:hypothetical protein
MKADPAKAIRNSPAPIQIHVKVTADPRVVIGDIGSGTTCPDEKLRNSDLPMLSGGLMSMGLLMEGSARERGCSLLRLEGDKNDCNSLRIVDLCSSGIHHRQKTGISC